MKNIERYEDKRSIRIEGLENGWHIKVGRYRYMWCVCGENRRRDEGMLYRGGMRNYTCRRCGNRVFFDSTAFLHAPHVLYWKALRWRYVHTQDEEGWHTLAVMYLPLFEFSSQSIVSHRVELARVSLLREGAAPPPRFSSLVGQRRLYKNGKFVHWWREIRYDLEALHVEYLKQHLPEPLRWMDGQTLPVAEISRTKELFAFFVRHAPLRSFDFFDWIHLEHFAGVAEKYPTVERMLVHILNYRREKSVRRAFFAGYADAMETGRYDPLYDYYMTRFVDNPNFLAPLLSIPALVKYDIFGDAARDDIVRLFRFVLRLYGEKGVMRLFLSSDKHVAIHRTVSDTIRMLAYPGMEREALERFSERRPKARFDILHDRLVALHRHRVIVQTNSGTFAYTKRALRAAGVFGTLRFVLPRNSTELEMWAQWLENCMFGYAAAIHEGRSVIYGVFAQERLYYAVEICEHRIVQALGKYNRPIDTDDMQLIRQWFEKDYLKAAGA